MTTSVAEGSFHTMKGLLTYDPRSMDPNTQIGYSLAMVNGDAFQNGRKCPCVQYSVRGLGHWGSVGTPGTFLGHF